MRIAGRHQKPGAFVLQQLHIAADRGGRDCLAGRHVLQNRIRHAFGLRAQDGDIQFTKKAGNVVGRSRKENSITKAPSAELRPDQKDSDSLPDYELLDPILAGYVDHDLGRAELIAAGNDPALVDRVLRMVDLAEYKRRQSAPGTKISGKAFGRDRRLPITNRFREGV